MLSASAFRIRGWVNIQLIRNHLPVSCASLERCISSERYTILGQKIQRKSLSLSTSISQFHRPYWKKSVWSFPVELRHGWSLQVQGQQKRCLWGWLNSIFNRVDESRIQEVGPDRACAEWLLRCGAGVKWDKRPDDWLRDYNSLPVGNYRALRIVEVDATDSAVMHIGFPHFRGLKHVRKAVFHRCSYLEDDAVAKLVYLKETLEELQISSCGNVSDEGILSLTQLKNLKKLTLYDFLEVRDRKHCLAELRKQLPNCDIHFPFARESDRDHNDSRDSKTVEKS